MAILNLIFGGWWLLMLLCAGFSIALMAAWQGMPGMFNPREMVQMIEQELPGYLAIVITSTTLSMALTVWLMVCGVGLLYMRGWARWGCVVAAVILILSQIVNLIVTLVWVTPVTMRVNEKMFADLAKQNPVIAAQQSQGMYNSPWINNASPVITAALASGYAVVLIWVMLKQNVAAAFRAHAAYRKGTPSPAGAAAHS